MSKIRVYLGAKRVFTNNKSRVVALTLSVILLSSFKACTGIKRDSRATNSASSDATTKISHDVGNQLIKVQKN